MTQYYITHSDRALIPDSLHITPDNALDRTIIIRRGQAGTTVENLSKKALELKARGWISISPDPDLITNIGEKEVLLAGRALQNSYSAARALTLNDTDGPVVFNAAAPLVCTVMASTLFPAALSGTYWTVVNRGTANVTFAAAGSDTIENTSLILAPKQGCTIILHEIVAGAFVFGIYGGVSAS